MKKLSMRLRLILFFTIISCVVWSCAGILAWSETKENIDEFFDTYQIALARQLAGTDWSRINQNTQKITDKLLDNIQGADDEDEAIGFAVFDAEGHKIFHDDENGKNFAYQNTYGSFVKQKVRGENWRLLWIKSTDGKFRIAIGQELEYREDMAWDMLEEFMTPWAIGLIVLLLAVIALIELEFKSLRKLANDIALRKADNLSPINDENTPPEVKPLTNAINNLLEKVNLLLQRERRFISDAAHELRTPLTALKIQLDVAKLSADDEPARESALNKLEQGINRATRLVEQLLALSRLETSLQTSIAGSEHIDWKLICEQLVNEYKTDVSAKNITVKINNAGSGAFNTGNSTLAELLLRNLLDNAIKYSPEKATVSINIGANYVQVCNSGVNISKSDLSKLGQRFFRIAGQNEKGNGIGLSIVKCIADFYNCDLVFSNNDNVFCAKVKRIDN